MLAVVLSLFAILIGLFGSAYQEQVVSAFPFRWRGPWGPPAGPVVAFWFALLGLGLGLYARQRADDAARDALQAATTRIDDATRLIQTSVQTLPPRSFLGELADTVASNRAVVYKTLHDPGTRSTAHELSAIARKMLHALAKLAYAYDHEPRVAGEPVVYTANVMDYGQGVADQLDAYFRDGAGTKIRSFISTPLDLPGRRVGVLNVHANATCVLAGERRYIFRALVAPMLIDLAEMVSALLVAEAAELQAAAAGATIKTETGHVQ